MKEYQIAVIPGDSIGHEIIPAGIQVLKVVAMRFGFHLVLEEFPYGAANFCCVSCED